MDLLSSSPVQINLWRWSKLGSMANLLLMNPSRQDTPALANLIVDTLAVANLREDTLAVTDLIVDTLAVANLIVDTLTGYTGRGQF